MNIRRLTPAIGAALLGCSTLASAVTFEPGAGLGWQYSDNVALQPDNTDADWGGVAYLGGLLKEEGGPLTYNAGGTVTYQRYANKTFDDTTYFNLNAQARWEQIDNRLNWRVSDFFTQSSVQSLGRDVPTNTQDTNVFSIAPDIAFPYASGHRFGFTPFFRDYYYEVSDTDNQQYGLDANWSYPMYPTLRLGVSGNYTDVNYDSSNVPDYVRSNLRLFISGSRPHSEYSVNAGTTRLSRDGGQDQTGFGGSVNYLYNFTGRSSVRLVMSTDLTDSSQTFFNSATDPDTGSQGNVQTSSDTFRNNVFTLTYNRKDETFNTRVWGELRKLDYDEAPRDRDAQELGANLDYRVNAYLGTGVFGSYIRIKQTDISRTDQRYVLGGRVKYNFSKKLSANASLQYRKRDSTLNSFNYDEYSALLGVVYGYVGRTTGLVGDAVNRRY